MQKTLSKVGNSWGIIIPYDCIMMILDMDPRQKKADNIINIEIKDNSIIVTKATTRSLNNRKLSKIGSSYGLLLSNEILSVLGINDVKDWSIDLKTGSATSIIIQFTSLKPQDDYKF